MNEHELAAKWAQEVLSDPLTAVLDTETTGLHGHVCEISVLASDGTFLINTLVHPPVSVEPGAQRIHGITAADLADAPTFADLWPELEPILSGRRIIVWNAPFDAGIIARDLRHIGKDTRYTQGWECAMLKYGEWDGEWDEYHGHYRWHRLNGGHRASEDCQAVYGRLRTMAGIG